MDVLVLWDSDWRNFPVCLGYLMNAAGLTQLTLAQMLTWGSGLCQTRGSGPRRGTGRLLRLDVKRGLGSATPVVPVSVVTVASALAVVPAVELRLAGVVACMLVEVTVVVILDCGSDATPEWRAHERRHAPYLVGT